MKFVRYIEREDLMRRARFWWKVMAHRGNYLIVLIVILNIIDTVRPGALGWVSSWLDRNTLSSVLLAVAIGNIMWSKKELEREAKASSES
jgi:uncharacterized membrane protein YraQ (UPF0718 family)